MGMLGQGARAVIGLKGMSTDARTLNLNPNDVFEAGRLITSIIIGFLVGLAAALVTLKSGDATIAVPGWTTLLGWVASGYAGTDFLEGFIAQYLPQGAPGSKAQKLVAADAAVKPKVAAIPSALSIVLNAFKTGFGNSSVTTGQDLSKDLGFGPRDYTKLEAYINVQLHAIAGATALDVNDVNSWENPPAGKGVTVGDVVTDVAKHLPR
jgi:hypothetical protein